MTKVKTVVLTVLISMLFTITSYAGVKTVSDTNVSVKVTASEPGTFCDINFSTGYYTYIEDITYAKDPSLWEPNEVVTATLLIKPKTGYKFVKGKTKVYCDGGTVASYAVTNASEIVANIKFRTVYTLGKVDSVWMSDEWTAEWNKVDFASAYEVKCWGSYSGTLTVTGKTKINLSSYATSDETKLYFKVRAVPKSKSQEKYLFACPLWTSYEDGVEQFGENGESGIWEGEVEDGKSTLRFLKWIDDEGSKWYASGWTLISNKWYYFVKGSLYAKLGWLNHNGKYYYLDPQTAQMVTGWMLDKDGKWYYFDSNGDMWASRWVQSSPNGPWYYLTESGEMLVNGITPDGYVVGPDGAWIH